MQWLLIILTLPYFILILRIYRGLLKLKAFNPSENGNQFISVIIACRNEELFLPRLLNYLEEQLYPSDLFEVIIVDDNSTDSTALLASSSDAPANISVIKNKGSGKKAAILTGINAARGSLIVTTDADCMMGKEWLQTISSFSLTSEADLIVCPVMTEAGKGFLGKFIEMEFLSLQGITAGTLSQGSGIMCNGANLAFRKEIYLSNQSQLHPEIESGDDVFLLHSLKRNRGSKIEWIESPEAAVKTSSPMPISKYFIQRGRWISKAPAYRDIYTILLGIVTFVTISIQLFLMAVCIFNRSFLIILVIAFLMKSVPDIILLYESARRRRRKGLLKWFIPSQVVYPFYVIIVAVAAILRKDKW